MEFPRRTRRRPERSILTGKYPEVAGRADKLADRGGEEPGVSPGGTGEGRHPVVPLPHSSESLLSASGAELSPVGALWSRIRPPRGNVNADPVCSVMCAGRWPVASAAASPVPAFRAKRGWAPPLICRRMRCPAAKWWAVALMGTVTCAGSCPPVRSRTSPSQTLRDRSVRVHVAEAGEDVGVAGVGGDPQPRGDRAEDVDGLGQRRAGERQDVLPCLQGAVVPGAGAAGEQGPAYGRGGVGRVVAEGRQRCGLRGGLPGERPVRGGEPGCRVGGRRPVVEVPPGLLAADMHAHRGGPDGRTGRRTGARAARRGSRRTPRASPAGARRCASRGRRARRSRIRPDAAGRTARRSGRPSPSCHPVTRLVGTRSRSAGLPRDRSVPVRIVGVRVGHHVVQPGHFAEGGDIRPAQGLRGADLAQAALKAQCRLQQGRRSLVLVRHADADREGVLQAERPARVEEGMRIVQADLDHHRLQLRWRVQGERPLHIAEVAGADGAQRSVEPGLLAQPGHRGPAVGGLVAPEVEAAA